MSPEEARVFMKKNPSSEVAKARYREEEARRAQRKLAASVEGKGKAREGVNVVAPVRRERPLRSRARL